MHPGLIAIATEQHGVFSTEQARQFGYSPNEIRHLIRTRKWIRLRRGIYADAATAADLDGGSRHRLATDAVLLAVKSTVFVSHFSAALLHGLELEEWDLDVVHITRISCRSWRNEAGVRFHAATAEPWELTEIDGRPVSSVARTAVDVARSTDFTNAVIAIDSALRRGGQLAEVVRVIELSRNWPGAAEAGRAVSFADPRSGSVGESRCRVTLHNLKLPAPETQVRFHDADGLIGIVDFYFRKQRTVAEFDGKQKYRVTDDMSAREASDVLWREKRREDRLRALGLSVVRVTWADLYRPKDLGARIRQAFRTGEEPLAG